MADSIKIQIGLTGDQEVNRKLAGVGQAGVQAFGDISQAADNTGPAIASSAAELAKLERAATRASAQMIKGMSGAGVAAAESAAANKNLVAGMTAAGQAAAGFVQVGQAAASAVRELGTHTLFTHGQMRELSAILRELGGPLGGMVGTVGKVGIGLGALAATAVAAGLAIKGAFDAAKNAADNAHGLERLAAVSGQSAEHLSALQVAFGKGGVSAKQFNTEFTNLALSIKEKAAGLALAIAESADKVVAAQLRVREAFLNVQRVELQGAQTNLQLQGLQQQLSVLGQVQSVERQRAQIAVGDARARLQSLVLQKQLRDGTITEEEFAERMARIEEGSLKREIQKAKLDVDAAERAALGLGQQQEMQEKQLQQQAQSLRLQQEANQIARERADLETRSADRDLTKAIANDLRAVIKAAQEIQAGLRTAFDPLTTAESKVQALIAVLGQAKDPMAALADIMKNLGSAAEAINIGKGLGLDADSVEVLRQGSVSLGAMAAAIKALGESLSAEDFTKLSDLRDALNNNAAAMDSFGNAVASFSADSFVAAIDKMTAALTRLNAARGQPSAQTPIPQLGNPELGIPFASGGLVRGRSGVDTNLAWLSNLEYVMRPAAVRKYGVNFMHTINSMQFPGFATGGLNLTVPANVGGGSTGGSNVTIQFPGLPAISGLRASSSVVDELHRAAALAQVRSGGRKPSRYS